jgi:hypothetical protein
MQVDLPPAALAKKSAAVKVIKRKDRPGRDNPSKTKVVPEYIPTRPASGMDLMTGVNPALRNNASQTGAGVPATVQEIPTDGPIPTQVNKPRRGLGSTSGAQKTYVPKDKSTDSNLKQ